MIYGIGIDMIETDRVAKKISRQSGFREFVFSKREIEYCDSKTNHAEHYAACFAAKEAFLKAIGTGWVSGISFNEIEIIHLPSGRPEVEINGETKNTVRKIGEIKINVSMTHLKNIAAAVVVVEKA